MNTINKKNDDILNNIYSNIDELPVAAQVEVLYDMNIERSLQNSSDGEKDTEESENEKTITGGVLQVAVFEGFLHNPNGSPLRWELASVRNPWEFR